MPVHMPRFGALFASLFLCGFLAAPLHAEILGMQMKRAFTEAEMKASLQRIELVDATGAPLNLRALMTSAKPTLVTQWAHWCPNCRGEIPGFKAIAGKCPNAWNIVFVSAQRSDYPKDLAAFQKYGLPFKIYNLSKAIETDPAKARVARAFFGETAEGASPTPQHYLIAPGGAVDAIIAGRMDFTDPQRLATFCAG